MTALALFAGKSAEWEFPVLQADGSVQDLTAATVRFTAKAARADADGTAVLERWSPSNGVVITDAVNGLCEVRLVPADTSAIVVPVELYWDLQFEGATGKEWSVDEGVLTIAVPVWAGAISP